MKIAQFHNMLLVGLSAVLLLSACRGTSTAINEQELIIPSVSVTEAPTKISRGKPTMTSGPPTSTQTPVSQADADVIYVKAVLDDQIWTFHVTVSHPDTGWDDYVNGWDVITPDGIVIKANESDPFTRLLLHPHETEQPFTRSQSGIIIPEGISQVHVRAHDLVDGYGGQEIIVDLSQRSGDGYEIIR